jgi:hypothetical protein
VAGAVSSTPIAEIASGQSWSQGLSSNSQLPNFSAFAWYFGKDLVNKLNVPIGIIEGANGGTTIDEWTSAQALAATEPNQVQSVSSDCFNGWINPIIPFAIKGVVWYQGESNYNSTNYTAQLNLLISNWRGLFNEGTMPFLIQELPDWGTAQSAVTQYDFYPMIRDNQFSATLDNANVYKDSGLAIADNIDNPDLHPPDKKPFGDNMAALAEGQIYGLAGEDNGPQVQSVTLQGSSLVVSFTHTTGGLTTADGAALRGFAIAGSDYNFVWANATINSANNTVVVSSSSVANPVYVRYAYARNASSNVDGHGANLANGASFRAGGFEYAIAPTGQPPAAPTGLSATPGTGQVTLNWSAVSTATSYNIYRGTSPGSETMLLAGVMPNTSFTDQGLSNGTYYYKITAVNDYGESGKSSEVSATLGTPAPVITSQPASVTVTTGQWASMSVTATGAGTLTYQWQKLVGGNWVAVSDGGDITGSQTVKLNFSATTAGDFGQYRVQVSNGGGTTNSNAATLTSAPTSFADSFTGNGSPLSGSWQIPPSFTPTAYRFQYRRKAPSPTVAFQLTSNAAAALGSSSSFAADQVAGVSAQNVTLQADLNASAAMSQAVGLFARLQSNGDAYVARITHSGTAQILLFHGASNSFTVLGSAAVPGNANLATLQFRLNGTSLSLFLNGSSTALVSVVDSTLTSGGVGICAWGANGTVGNFSVGGS